VSDLKTLTNSKICDDNGFYSSDPSGATGTNFRQKPNLQIQFVRPSALVVSEKLIFKSENKVASGNGRKKGRIIRKCTSFFRKV
jgi:hypothetical protein